MTFERHEQAKKWIAEGKQLTGDAERFKVDTVTDAQKRVVRVLEQSETVIKPEVSTTSSDNMAAGFLAVELDLSTHEITCPCLWTVETSCSYPQNTIGMERFALVSQNLPPFGLQTDARKSCPGNYSIRSLEEQS
jgi:hypothetical protein